MGYTLTAKNSKYCFDGGMGMFFNLRCNIAKCWDEKFGSHYATLNKCCEKADYEAFDKKANEILQEIPEKTDADEDILDFLFASDIEGSIPYKTCNKIFNLIKDVQFTHSKLRYYGSGQGDDYEDFKSFLQECYSHRRKAVWY